MNHFHRCAGVLVLGCMLWLGGAAPVRAGVYFRVGVGHYPYGNYRPYGYPGYGYYPRYSYYPGYGYPGLGYPGYGYYSRGYYNGAFSAYAPYAYSGYLNYSPYLPYTVPYVGPSYLPVPMVMGSPLTSSYQSGYYQPGTASPALRTFAPTAPNIAVMQVRLPDPDAEVFLNGQKMKTTGATRVFQTPELDQGKKFLYDVTAKFTRDGRTVTEERTVEVTAGGNTVVDFTRPAAP